MDILKRSNVVVKGEGEQAMILLHGFGCDRNMWRHVIPAFEKNYKIIIFDHAGTGQYDMSAYRPAKYDTLNGYADDLVEICNYLELQDAIFVGHSVSAMIGALASIQSPQLFSALVMIGPSPCYINDEDYHGGFEREDIEELMEALSSNYLGWSSAMAPAIIGNSDRPYLGEELTNHFCQMDPIVAEQFARTTFFADNRADLKHITLPSLILQCEEDIIAPLSVGIYMHENISNSKLVRLNATGHCPNLSAPKETTKEIRDFLQSL